MQNDSKVKTDRKTRHYWLYVLRLEQGKWYVGITTKTPEIRMQEHSSGVRAAYWTAIHKPIEIAHREDLGATTKAQAEKRENKMTRALMKQRGINNVRGGDLTDVEDYILRFGWYRSKDMWDTITIIILLMLYIVYLLIDKYLLS
jgi:predicted GIY-YIG superfamily endonuclease